MRRTDREVTDKNKKLEILSQCHCCRLGLIDEEGTYIVPLNFGYQEKDNKLSLYFHCANEGKKLELIKKQNYVGFEMDRKHELVKGDTACKYSFLYQSIIGKGKIEIISEFQDKVKALEVIMSHYTEKGSWEFNKEAVNRIAVLKLNVDQWSCKEH